MSKVHKFGIKVGQMPYDCRVTLNGEPLEGVTRASLTIAPNEPTTIHLTIMGEIEVEGEFREEAIIEMRRPNASRL